MEIEYTPSGIVFEKELNELDLLTLDFVKCLDKANISYSIISGYVAILFGRSRNSEDIDIFCEVISKESFSVLWKYLHQSFECIITNQETEAYKDYLCHDLALRFSRKEKYVPNVELKFVKSDLDKKSLSEAKTVILNKKFLKISPLEIQIPFKLYLGTEKDIEDARFLYKLFKEKLDMAAFDAMIEKLKVRKLRERYL